MHDLISSNDQITISNNNMQIEEYEIMLIWEQLKDKKDWNDVQKDCVHIYLLRHTNVSV
jgi:hypothetical protein